MIALWIKTAETGYSKIDRIDEELSPLPTVI